MVERKTYITDDKSFHPRKRKSKSMREISPRFKRKLLPKYIAIAF